MNDDILRDLMHRQMRQDAGNPYFIRKVMNRLPGKQRMEPCLWILRAAYLVAFVLLGVFWLRLVLHGDMFGEDLMDFIALWSLTLVVCLYGLHNVEQRAMV